MKYILAILALVALAQAKFVGDVDLSNLKIRRLVVKEQSSHDNVAFEERIIGGEVAEPNSIPYQAVLIITTTTGTYLCSGVLVSTTHILTAAHCLVGASQVQVRLGAHFWNQIEATQQRFFTNQIRLHEGWNGVINDIGVVTLATPALLNENVQVAILPTYADAGTSFAGTIARISGWGADSDYSGVASDELREVMTDVLSNFSCNLGLEGNVISSQVCTSGAQGRGACIGDSGGPVTVGYKLIGLISYNAGLLCDSYFPTVHTRITFFLDWISEHTDAIVL